MVYIIVCGGANVAKRSLKLVKAMGHDSLSVPSQSGTKESSVFRWRTKPLDRAKSTFKLFHFKLFHFKLFHFKLFKLTSMVSKRHYYEAYGVLR